MRYSFSFLHRSLRHRSLHHTSYSKSSLQNRMPAAPLDYSAGPLVWIDCEMTGLDPRKDKILEIAVLITNGKLQLVDNGIQYIIKTEKEVLDGMGEWCTNQHRKSGLTKACLDSPHTREFVASEILKYIKKWIPQPRVGVLAGNSVHADRTFLVEEMPEVVEWLHYRIVDVSSIKELSRRWFPATRFLKPDETSHRALEDIRGSIRELQWYRDNIFSPPEQVKKTASHLPPLSFA